MIECILVRASIRFEAFLWVYIVDYANELIFAHQLKCIFISPYIYYSRVDGIWSAWFPQSILYVSLYSWRMIEFCALILRLDVLAWNIFEFTCVWYLNFLRILRGIYYNTWFLLCFIVLTNVLAWLINLGLVISPAYQVLWNPFKDIIRKQLFSILRRRIYDEYNKKLILLVWKLGRCMNST